MASFSIITPNLNQARYLKDCLRSVSKQTHRAVEHLVLDGNSTDASYELLCGFEHEKRFVYLRDSDSGQSDAINKGFSLATGDILAWLNADDQYASPKVLSLVADVFDRNPDVDVVYGRGDYVNARGKKSTAAWIQSDAKRLSKSLASSVGIIQPSVFFKRSQLDRIGFIDESNHHSMDYDYWIRLALSGAKFYFLDNTLSRAVLHENAKSVSHRTAQLRETVEVCFKHYHFAHPRWITAYARSAVFGESSFLDTRTGKDGNEDAEKTIQVESIERAYFRRYNNTRIAIDALVDNDPEAADAYLERYVPERTRRPNVTRANTTLERHQSCDIGFYPEFDRMDDLRDCLERVRWYLPEATTLLARLFVTRSLRIAFQENPASISVPGNVSIAQRPESDPEYARLLSSSRSLGIWQNFGRYAPPWASDDLKVFNLDRHHENRREAFQSAILLHELDSANREEMRQHVAELAQNLFGRLTPLQNAYLFCTGPSVSEALRFDYSDGYRIVCNSIVINDTLMEHIEPQFVVAADPVFHFGSSDYAYAFRDRLRAAVDRYNTFVLVPFFYYPLIAQNCPDLRDRIIGIGQHPENEFNFDLKNSLEVRGSDNILTLLMIPLAATLATNIFVLGCDGRTSDEQYFWKHDPSSQFNSLMQSAKTNHPGFFNHVSYSDYYEEHCRNLERMILALESGGKSLQTMATSHIPCLANRPSRMLI